MEDLVPRTRPPGTWYTLVPKIWVLVIFGKLLRKTFSKRLRNHRLCPFPSVECSCDNRFLCPVVRSVLRKEGDIVLQKEQREVTKLLRTLSSCRKTSIALSGLRSKCFCLPRKMKSGRSSCLLTGTS